MYHGAGVGVLPRDLGVDRRRVAGVCMCLAVGDGGRLGFAVYPTGAAESGGADGRADVEDGDGEEAFDPGLIEEGGKQGGREAAEWRF